MKLMDSDEEEKDDIEDAFVLSTKSTAASQEGSTNEKPLSTKCQIVIGNNWLDAKTL